MSATQSMEAHAWQLTFTPPHSSYCRASHSECCSCLGMLLLHSLRWILPYFLEMGPEPPESGRVIRSIMRLQGRVSTGGQPWPDRSPAPDLLSSIDALFDGAIRTSRQSQLNGSVGVATPAGTHLHPLISGSDWATPPSPEARLRGGALGQTLGPLAETTIAGAHPRCDLPRSNQG